MPSSVIKAFDYDAAARELDVLFTTGRRYAYLDVPPETAEELRAAFSKGQYFNRHIRPRFRYRRRS